MDEKIMDEKIMGEKLDAAISKIDDRLLTYMKRGFADINYKGDHFLLLGRGGEANVYSLGMNSDIGIKVYRDNTVVYKNPEIFFREIFVIDNLRQVDQLRDHIVNVIDYNTKNVMYMLMEVYNGDLSYWAFYTYNNIGLSRKRYNEIPNMEKTEEEWLSMIFQVTYIFTELNSRGVLHDDTKPKNIFFLDNVYVKNKMRYLSGNNNDNNDNNVNDFIPMTKKYYINGTVFEIPFKYRFIVGDFSRVRIADYDPDVDKNLLPGHGGGPDIYENFVNKTDLYELSRIVYRVMVDIMEKYYNMNNIRESVDNYSKTDPKFKQNIENETKRIKRDFIYDAAPDVVEKMREKMILRSHMYILIEFEYITREHIQKIIEDNEVYFTMPSQRVLNILKRVNDPNETMETLFDFFIVNDK
jgi:hypothetical protein